MFNKPYSDSTFRKYIDPILSPLVQRIPESVTPIHITLIGFLLGMLAPLFIYMHFYTVAFFFIIINRICDALDGNLAQYRKTQSFAGAFLDIVLDFIFYASIPFAFGFTGTKIYAYFSLLCLFSIFLSAVAFLAFSILATKSSLTNPEYAKKSFYYMSGMIEGTETILYLLFITLFPSLFLFATGLFSLACLYTGIQRIFRGTHILLQHEE
ncbi:MAG: CDP-alcohol phosphatidyltransferase family protein [Desulfovibrionaceae bacterium]